MAIRIKKRKQKQRQGRGFDPNIGSQKKTKHRWIAIEINVEQWVQSDEFPNLRESEVLDVLEIHHISIAPIVSTKDLSIIQHYTESIAGSIYISPTEFIAEMYATYLNDHALSIGANVGRIYHNSYLGDTRIHGNSIAHIFEPSDFTLPSTIMKLMDKYLTVEHIANGKDVTLWNRLGVVQ